MFCFVFQFIFAVEKKIQCDLFTCEMFRGKKHLVNDLSECKCRRSQFKKQQQPCKFSLNSTPSSSINEN